MKEILVILIALFAGAFTFMEDAPLNLDAMFGLGLWKPFEVVFHTGAFFVVAFAVLLAYRLGKKK